jgi:hypothetical protein
MSLTLWERVVFLGSPTPKRAIGFCVGFPTRDAYAVMQEVRRKWFAQQVSERRRKPIEFIGPLARLAEVQESPDSRGKAGSGRGLEPRN